MEKKYCRKNHRELPPAAKTKYGFFAGLLLVILPKCPFCILAYSSTIVLCGKDRLIENQHHTYSVLSLVITTIFCSLIIAGLLLNFRGTRTKYALAIAGAGILVVLNSVIRNGGQELYYFGLSVIFLAIWLNGSLISILRKFKNTLHITKRNVAGSP